MGNYKALPSCSPPISVTNERNDIGHLVLNDGGRVAEFWVKYTIGHYNMLRLENCHCHLNVALPQIRKCKLRNFVKKIPSMIS